jgi:4-amino-4-deoxy-L-arabinose transferase-like glycosyltransferase
MIKPQPSELVIRHWSFVIALLLFTWGLRLCCLETVPPGWRDDELINIHALSGELLEGRFPLYFTGASGHEPLYHYLLAGVHAVLGFNVLSGHFLSIALGTLTVALAYSLTRSLFGRVTAVVASLALTISFWSLMYSRTAIRHISLPPLVLATFYLFWCSFTNRSQTSNTCTALRMQCRCIKSHILLGFTLGMSLYAYPAARLLPVLFILFAIYLALFHRARFNHQWRGFLLALAVMIVLALPLGIAIVQGRTEAAAQGIGADARLDELAVPLRELKAGNPRPLLESTWTTLGMFHATGDPEWLYNIPGRPVFNLLGGALLWAGVALCLYRWRQPRYFFLLLWLGLGLSPAFVSTPPASLSHTILAQPVAYILPALVLTEIKSRISNPKSQTLFIVYCSLFILFLTTNAVRDLRDYFITWPQRGMVRLLYRADCRQAAAYLDAHTEITDIAISSALLGPWDRLALEVDIQRDDIAVRLFDPERALIWVAEDASSPLLLTSWPDLSSPIEDLLEASGDPPEAISSRLTLYALPSIRDPRSATLAPRCGCSAGVHNSRFANGLELVEVRWLDETTLLATWRVAAPLDLPPIPVVANPPPPGVYSGPRLAVFVHLLDANGALFAAEDGLWVDPLTLRPGDRFVQIHRFAFPQDMRSYTLELGLYDPLTGERWAVLDAEGQPVADYILLPGEEAKP